MYIPVQGLDGTVVLMFPLFFHPLLLCLPGVILTPKLPQVEFGLGKSCVYSLCFTPTCQRRSYPTLLRPLCRHIRERTPGLTNLSPQHKQTCGFSALLAEVMLDLQ